MTRLIVGAGPIGSYLATRSPATICDQKPRPGIPVRCTGVLTDTVTNQLDKQLLQKSIQNTITQTTVHINNTKIKLPLRPNYIICNKTFEEELLHKAQDSGSKVHLNHKYLKSEGQKHLFKDQKSQKIKELKSKELIGIDGPQSQVNKTFNIHKGLKKLQGYQIRLKVKENDNNIHFYPKIGKYSWFVPESENIVRIGVCSDKEPKKIFNDFIKRFKGTTLDIQAGFIPLHKPFIPTVKHQSQVKISLLGDAAGHIKNTTGGGIVPGIMAARQYTSKYAGIKGVLRRELYCHFLVHNFLQSCKTKEWNLLAHEAKKYAAQSNRFTRDELSKLAPDLISNPKLFALGAKKVLSGKVPLW